MYWIRTWAWSPVCVETKRRFSTRSLHVASSVANRGTAFSRMVRLSLNRCFSKNNLQTSWCQFWEQAFVLVSKVDIASSNRPWQIRASIWISEESSGFFIFVAVCKASSLLSNFNKLWAWRLDACLELAIVSFSSTRSNCPRSHLQVRLYTGLSLPLSSPSSACSTIRINGSWTLYHTLLSFFPWRYRWISNSAKLEAFRNFEMSDSMDDARNLMVLSLVSVICAISSINMV